MGEIDYGRELQSEHTPFSGNKTPDQVEEGNDIGGTGL